MNLDKKEDLNVDASAILRRGGKIPWGRNYAQLLVSLVALYLLSSVP